MLGRFIGLCAGILCGYAGYWAARWTVADYTVKTPSRSRFEQAIRLAPGNPEYYVRLAGSDPVRALWAVDRAAQLNPLSSPAWIEFAHAAEAHNDFPSAERALIRAAQLDKTFGPRWLLTEYYSRRNDEAHFWPAARAALATSYDDVTPIFDLCWRFSSDPQTILDRAVPNRRDVLQQYFDFVLTKNRLDAVQPIASQLIRDAGQETVPSLLGYCDRLLENNEPAPAVEVWNALSAKRLLQYPALAVAQGRGLTNDTFARPFLGRGFDWRLNLIDGIFVQNGDGSRGMRFEFSGKQPESCYLLTEWVPVEPTRAYQLAVRYQTSGLEGETGLKWRVLDGTTGDDLMPKSGWMTGDERQEMETRYEFFTREKTRLVKLALSYQRLPGTVRIEGSLALVRATLGFGR